MLVCHTDSCIVTVMPMKKLLPLLIILLLLAGCGEIPESKTVTVTLPVPTGPTAPQLWSYSPPKSQSPFDLISIRLALHAEPDGLLYISGPAGTVAAKPFGESVCLGSAIGDVDGDGEDELVYLCPQEDSALLCVYGLEDGWPVCKGSAALKPEPPGQFFPVESSLETIDGKVIYHACLEHWDEESQDWIPDSKSSLAVVLEDGQLRLEGAGKTAGISCTGVPGDYFGASFSALSQQLGENALLRSRSCLVWMERQRSSREDAAAELIRTWAVLTDNGVTVTGLLTLEQRPDGGFTEAVNGFEPIAPLSNPANLAALSAEKLEDSLGSCHFVMGDDTPVLCWFARNYELLIVNPAGLTVEVLDLKTGETAVYKSKPLVTDRPILSEGPENAPVTVSGPAGTVEVFGLTGGDCETPVYGDIDGDGDTELVFQHSYYSDDQKFYAFYVYSLEAGWPINECYFLLRADNGTLQLAAEKGSVLLGYTRSVDLATPVLLRLSLKDGLVELRGDLAAVNNIEVVMEPFDPILGGSFPALFERSGSQILFQQDGCLVWTEPVDSTDESNLMKAILLCAASDNGSTVTKLFSWYRFADGSFAESRDSSVPAPPADPAALLNLPVADLVDLLGPCHFQVPPSGGKSLLPGLCWITRDRKLLTISPLQKVARTDLLTGEVSVLAEADPDTVCVYSSQEYDGILNLQRWNNFYLAAIRGEPDAVTVLEVSAEELHRKVVSYDGQRYALSEDGETQSYAYLVIRREVINRGAPSSTQVGYDSSLLYLLSDDRSMTYSRYWNNLKADSPDPNFPNTCLVLSVYSQVGKSARFS